MVPQQKSVLVTSSTIYCFSNGWGSWSSGGSGSGWGGGSSGSCGWGCQEFEELFHSNVFGGVSSDEHEHEEHEDYTQAQALNKSYANTLTGEGNYKTNGRVTRAVKQYETNRGSTRHRGLKEKCLL